MKTASGADSIGAIGLSPRGKRRQRLFKHGDDLRRAHKFSSRSSRDGPRARGGSYSIALRLRESNALELQQRMLSDMGRVGLVSKMPFTFPVEVLMFTSDAQGNPKRLELPITTRDGGVCITGRDSNADVTRLILTEASVDEILNAIPKIEEAQVHERARETLKRLQASASFRSLLQRGLKAPATPKGSLGQLKVPAEKKEGEEKAPEEIVGLIVRNPGELRPLSGNDLKNGALVIVVNDLEAHQVTVGEIESATAAGPLDESFRTEAEAKRDEQPVKGLRQRRRGRRGRRRNKRKKESAGEVSQPEQVVAPKGEWPFKDSLMIVQPEPRPLRRVPKVKREPKT